MTLSRRALLGAAGAGAAGLALGLRGLPTAQASTGAVLRSRLPLPAPFSVELPLPRAISPRPGGVVALTARVADAELLPGRSTQIWGYDGTFPGPTLETRSGAPLVVTHRNELPVPMAVHLHGGRTAAADDGYPTDLILPVGGTAVGGMGDDPRASVATGSRAYRYPQQQRAAQLWYHDHRMGFTAPAVWRGLAGLHVVRDAEEDALGLPSGDRELPLVLTDRSFGGDAELLYPSLDPALAGEPGVSAAFAGGVLGDVVLVNGAPNPRTAVGASRYRLRVLNASNARRYRLVLDPSPPDGGPAFVQIGTDGGLLAAPQPLGSVELASAQRYDLLVDFGRYPVGTQVRLRNTSGEAPTTRELVRFDVVRRQSETAPVPARLGVVDEPDPSAAVATRTFLFRNAGMGWTINGRGFDAGRTDASPRAGTTEVWRFVSDLHHPIHLHLAPMRVLGRGLGGPGRFDAGLKDVVDLRPAERVEVAVRFDGSPGRYLFHCHNLEHEDMAMMANYELLA